MLVKSARLYLSAKPLDPFFQTIMSMNQIDLEQLAINTIRTLSAEGGPSGKQRSPGYTNGIGADRILVVQRNYGIRPGQARLDES